MKARLLILALCVSPGFCQTASIVTGANTGGLIIIPTFDSSITTDPNSAAIEDTVNSAIAALEPLFADPITVSIYFRYSTTLPNGSQNGPGSLSHSNYGYYSIPYATFINALKADSKTVEDASAIGNLPGSPPASRVDVTSALGRALGMNTPGFMAANSATDTGGVFDGIVTLNSSQPFQFNRAGGIGAGSFDARRMVEHEIDEVLGLGSVLPSSTDASGQSAVKPEDLFRYSANGSTSLTNSGAASSYFSIDGGATTIAAFNQQSNGDYGDWLSPSCAAEAATPLVQYAFTCAGVAADVSATSPEGIALDVIGYDLSSLNAPPSITPGGIVPVYSRATTIQPGEWVSIYGTNLGPASPAIWTGNFPTSLGGTSVTIDGKSAYLWFVSSTQINLQAPDDTGTGAPVSVVVSTPAGTAASTVTLAQFAPSFSLLDSKHVAGIIVRPDGSGAYGGGEYDIIGPTGSSLGYATVAAKAGDTVELYGVGFGPTLPAAPAGQVFSAPAPTTNKVSLFIDNVSVVPTFAGLSSAGLYQINLTIPAGLGAGDFPLAAGVAGAGTPSNVVISLQ